MNFHLTGRMVACLNNASVRWHYSTDRGGWPVGLLGALGLEGLLAKWPKEVLAPGGWLGPARSSAVTHECRMSASAWKTGAPESSQLFPPPHPAGEVVGGLTAAAAAHLGLLEGLPVAQGGADAFIGMIGLGVLEAGQMALLTGSSHLHLGLTDRKFHGAGIWGTYTDALLPGLSIVEGGQTSTGSVAAWFRRLVGEGDYAALGEEAAAVPPGCEGVVALDHFQGNRTPHTDALSRGAVTGLTLKHGRCVGAGWRGVVGAGTRHMGRPCPGGRPPGATICALHDPRYWN